MADYFVDASIGTDTGSGTVLDPWGHTGNEIQKALDNITQGAGGDTIHVQKDTAVDFGGTALDFSTYTATNYLQPLCISAYDAAAWDVTGTSTVCGLNLNTGVLLPGAAATDGIILVNCDVYGGSAGTIVDGDQDIHLLFSKIRDGDVHVDSSSSVQFCYFENGKLTMQSGLAYGNYFKATTMTTTYCIYLNGVDAHAVNNLIRMDGLSTYGAGLIYIGNNASSAVSNTIISTGASTARGITLAGAAESGRIVDNYIEGFSGVGGSGIDALSGGADGPYPMVIGNRAYNNATDFNINTTVIDVDNEALSASGLNNLTDCLPVNGVAGAGLSCPFLPVLETRATGSRQKLKIANLVGMRIGA